MKFLLFIPSFKKKRGVLTEKIPKEYRSKMKCGTYLVSSWWSVSHLEKVFYRSSKQSFRSKYKIVQNTVTVDCLSFAISSLQFVNCSGFF